MKKILRKLARFFIPLAVISIACIVISKSVLRHGNFYKLKPDTQCIILGHSQTECDINDSLIDHTQNFSMGGEAYLYTYQKLKKLIADNPQVNTVLISFANNQVEREMDKWTWQGKSMYNYYPNYSFMMDWADYKVLLSHNPLTVLKSETKAIKNFAAFMIKNHRTCLSDRNWGGYLYLKRNKIDSLLKTDYLKENNKRDYTKLSKTNINYLTKIVEFCKEKNIRIVFLRMPARPELPILQNESQYQAIKKTKFPEIESLDFKNFHATTDEFGDFEHLNHKGARRFSVFFNDLLKAGLLSAKNPQHDIDVAIKTLTLKDSTGQ